jgi:hypothetical protein
MKPVSIIKPIIAAFFIAALLPFLSSCTKKIYFETSVVVPAARGYAKIKKDKNENYTIQISISNLAEVERLQAGKKTYVVWMIAGRDNAKNIGQINSSMKRFSKSLSASFGTVSPAKPEKIFITAEEDGTVHYPGNLVVLTADIR